MIRGLVRLGLIRVQSEGLYLPNTRLLLSTFHENNFFPKYTKQYFSFAFQLSRNHKNTSKQKISPLPRISRTDRGALPPTSRFQWTTNNRIRFQHHLQLHQINSSKIWVCQAITTNHAYGRRETTRYSQQQLCSHSAQPNVHSLPLPL